MPVKGLRAEALALFAGRTWSYKTAATGQRTHAKDSRRGVGFRLLLLGPLQKGRAAFRGQQVPHLLQRG